MIDVVVKVGGALLRDAAAYEDVVNALSTRDRTVRILVVPGGGPFADAVRVADRALAFGDDAAHWMAVLAMDQHAHVLASRAAESVVVADSDEIGAAIAERLLPVLAPYAWLRATDPLPHSWDVTSDSIAAWVAGRVGARRLVLIKVGASEADLAARAVDRDVDGYFARAVPSGVDVTVVPPGGVRDICQGADARRGDTPRTAAVAGRGPDGHNIGAHGAGDGEVLRAERAGERDGEAGGVGHGDPPFDRLG
jgi:aspartokinase-like uncharacterized kinase